jgi:two-component system NtrC family sensor kinase
MPQERPGGVPRRRDKPAKGPGGAKVRRSAAARLAGHEPPVALPPGATRPELLHELRVHQAELELQNQELRRSQVAVEEVRDRYLELYDFAPLGYLTLDRTRRIADLNLAAARLLGADRAALRGRPFLPLVDRPERARWSAFLEAVQAGQAARTCELSLRPAGGGAVPVELTCVAVSPGRAPAPIRCALVDVTERRRAEAERERRIAELQALNARLGEARLQLLQSDKLAAIGQLAAGVAHELNNPLAYVKSSLFAVDECVEALLAAPRAPAWPGEPASDLDPVRAELRQTLAEAREGIDRVVRVVGDLRAFAHADTGHWERSDLHDIVDRALRIVTGATGAKVRLARAFAAEAPRVRCRPSQLEQVFMNLLVNAAQAVRAGGTVEVRTGRSGEQAWVEVEDTGPGIPQAHLARIFEPFFTTKPVGVGTGLGLSLAHGIVRAHGGAIEVRSVVGAGTTFRVTLPLDGPGPGPADGDGRYGG